MHRSNQIDKLSYEGFTQINGMHSQGSQRREYFDKK